MNDMGRFLITVRNLDKSDTSSMVSFIAGDIDTESILTIIDESLNRWFNE